MPDFTQVIAMLEDIRRLAATAEIDAKLDAVEQELGLLAGDVPPVEPVIPPSVQIPGFEIYGGAETERFPDCCAIGNDDDYYCTGTLIAPTVVVTARHCDDGVTRVFLKGNNIANPAAGETIPVVAEYENPDVDLRVVVLARPASVPPRHVAQGDEVYAPEMVTLAGFGTMDSSGQVGYGIKREVDVPLTSLDCSAPNDFYNFGGRAGREMVAGQRGLARDSCKGDSGGPLYIQSRNGDDVYLLGATSRGIRRRLTECGDGGIYVRVDRCLDWIGQVTGVDVEGPLT